LYNQAGASAIQTPDSRWLIYDINPTLENSLGGIPYNFLMVGVTVNSLPPEKVRPAGNGYLPLATVVNPSQYIQPPSGASDNPAGSGSSNSTLAVLAGGESGIFSPDPDLISPQTAQFASPFTVVLAQRNATATQLPVQLGVPYGELFVTPMSGLMGEGGLHELTVDDGSALPNWLKWSNDTLMLSGYWPNGRQTPLKLHMVVRSPQTGEERELEIIITPLSNEALQARKLYL
jgi:hypothetical protein